MRQPPPQDDERPTAREVLATNVRKLIDAAKDKRPEIASILKVAEHSKKLSHGRSSLSKSRVGRIVKGSHTTDVDALSDLAAVFNLEPWQLLVEGLNPEALPSLTTSPLLEEIRSLVAARAPLVPQSASRQQNNRDSSLERHIKTETKGATDAESNSDSRVSKPRSGRDAAGNARARRSR